MAFTREDGALLCDGIALTGTAERFGTPLYVYSRASIGAAHAAFERAFSSTPHRICYALKANSTGGLLRFMASLGAGADVVSGGELEAAIRAGFPPEGIVFSGVGKTDAELRLGLERGIGIFNVESEAEIRRLDSIAEEARVVARIALRVNPAIDPRSHPYISTGVRESKFGIPIEEAPSIVERSRGLRYVKIIGLQCHIGSQLLDLEPIGEASRALAELSRRLLERGVALETVDLGGGLGLDYEGGMGSDPEALASRILPPLAGLPLTLILEPGRSLVGGAGVLLTRVLGQKENGGRFFVIVDAGMNDLLRPALYQAFHRIEPVVSRGEPKRRVDVVGPVCEEADFLGRGVDLENVKDGDLLAVRDVGAYGFSMSSRYNLRPRPAEVLIEEGAERLLRRRETLSDLTATEMD